MTGPTSWAAAPTGACAQSRTWIQFFEAQIDDQPLPRTAYDDLLSRRSFSGIGGFGLAPVHAVTDGRRTNN